MRSTICMSMLGLFMVTGIARGENKCQTTCEAGCGNFCPEVKNCADTEIDCGPKPTTSTDFCQPDRVCVASNCQCPTKDNTGEDCPVVCAVECGDGKLLCPGSTDSRGCQQSDQCVNRGTDSEGNFCPGVCPVSCNEDEVLCPMPTDSSGCETPPMCKTKGTDINGNVCPGVCPTICNNDEILCTGKTSDIGCQEKDACVKRGTNNEGDLCHGFCPVECNEHEILCEGGRLPDGCRSPDVCNPRATDVNGDFCPDNSASHHCPKTCEEDEELCAGQENAIGCREEDVCKAKTKDTDGNFCPGFSVCPSPCKINEVMCAGGMDIFGCKNPDLCLPRDRNYNGDLCSVHCPKLCTEEQTLCVGKRNSEGCKEEDTCVDRGRKTTEGSDKDDGLCPGYCPVECEPDEIKCPVQHDCDGCETEEVCLPAAKDVNGEVCDAESASHNCPKICDEAEGKVLCPGHETALGCKSPPTCVQRALDKDGDFCPSYSVCETQCHEGHGEMRCPDGLDSNGCKNEDRCILKGKDNDGKVCVAECPPVCNEEEVLCPGGIKGNGCKDIDVCVMKVIGNDGAQCRTACPVTCTAAEENVAGGVDLNGCPREDICSAPKSFSDWANVDECVATGANPACGPGTIVQTRTCTDGTFDKCTDSDIQRTVTCSVAGVSLPACGATDLGSCMECVDVGFVVDVSGSVGSHYPEEQAFVKQFARSMGVSKNGAHASVVQFSNQAWLEIPFMDDATTFTTAVDALNLNGGSTRIDKGLDVAFAEMFQTANGMREECSKLVVVMTDGVNNEPLAPMDAAKRFHDAGIRVVVVGIGQNVDTDELLSLVEVDSDLHKAQNFDELTSDSFVDSLVKCEDLSHYAEYVGYCDSSIGPIWKTFPNDNIEMSGPSVDCLVWCKDQMKVSPEKNITCCDYDGSWCYAMQDATVTGADGTEKAICWALNGNGDFVGLEDKCGEKCDVRSGVCTDINDGSIIETDACSANHPCYPGCWKTCDNESAANYCPDACSGAAEVNPGEASRIYSSVWSNEAPGTGHAQSMLDSPLGWCALENTIGEWMQIDLGTTMCVNGAVTQSRSPAYGQWVTSYKLSYSTDGTSFTELPEVYAANDVEGDARKTISFKGVQARYVRFIPQTWHSHMSMRAGVIAKAPEAT